MDVKTTTLDQLRRTVIDDRYKGIPLGESLTLSEIVDKGWNVARGDLALPVTTLRQSALENNLKVMAAYCERHGALFAPHGKTTMSPQLFARQIQSGAWGLTAATPTQVAVMRHFGFNRILLANELTEFSSIRWIAHEMETDGSFELLSLVDNASTVALVDAALDDVLSARRLPVLVEIGIAGGRGGTRTQGQVLDVARSVKASRHLILAGVETYEGLVTSGDLDRDVEAVDSLCADVRDAVRQISSEGLFEVSPVTITAGGSAYFDRIVALLSDWSELDVPVQLVLRSGCYITHDQGKYHLQSPLDGRRSSTESLHLENALEGWATVLSRPEPSLAILGTGKRDLPYDAGLPTPQTLHAMNGSPPLEIKGHATIFKMMDQHAFMTVPPDLKLRPGDIVTLGMSHPCTAFDKMRLVPVIDDHYNVVDAVLTFF